MKRLARSRFAWLALAIAMPFVMSCKDETIVGSYTATKFTYASGGTPKDALAEGATIHLTIANDLSTSGTMSIPASVTGTSALSVGLLGTAAKTGDSVQLNLVQDSFLRDMTFNFDGSALNGASTFSGTTVVITLSK